MTQMQPLMPSGTCQPQTAAVIAATSCPGRLFDGAHSNILAKNKLPSTAQPSISTRHALPDAHGYKLHRTSTHARPREDSHPNTFVRRPRRCVGAAHAVPPPADTARPDHKAKERENDGRYPCLRWHGRAFARGARGKLAQVKLIKPAPRPRPRPADGPTRRPTRPSAPA